MNATKFSHLEKFSQDHRGWLFRGLKDSTWNLETSLERASKRCGKPQEDYERKIVREFQRHAHAYLPRVPKDDDQLEWLALMQHYGAPTRLLDFTKSFWIALFFAFESAERECIVWALNPASLGNKNNRDFNPILRENIESGMHSSNSLYEDAPFFTNERLAIQKGTFVFSLNLKRSFHNLFIENRKEHKTLLINDCLFSEIRQRLNDYNCNSRVLFPGIDGYARYFQNHTS